jgi:hypothetical protein
MRLILLFIGLLAPLTAVAEPLVTDRPTAGESSLTVGWRTFQIEVGPDLEQDSLEGVTTRNLRTPVEIRYGLTENTEIHVQSAGFASQRVTVGDGQEEDNGVADLELGFKTHFFSGSGVLGIPSTGMSVTFVIPVGTEPFRSPAIIPTAKLLFDWPLPQGFVINANLGTTLLNVNDPRTRQVISAPVLWSAALGRSIAGPVAGFAELYGEIPTRSFEVQRTSAAAGLAVLLNDNIQVDLAGRWGLNEYAADWGVTAGISFRHDWR